MLFRSQKEKNQGKTWSFAWKIKNRPTCCDFVFFPDPQLHQIFKPIRKLFCISLLTVDFMLSPAPPLDFFLAKKGGGGLSTYFLTLAKFGLKKGGGDLAWDFWYEIFWEKIP